MTPQQNSKTIEDLKRKVEEADALADMKSNFLATMSHEIRTPMQTIFGLLELIADEKPSDKVQEMVGTAQGAAAGLLEILDDILDLAKMDADKMELDMFEVPVRLLVRGLLEALAVKVHGVNIELIDDIEQDVPFVVVGDPKRLRQIIMNLCGNALKFTHQGSVTVKVTTKTQHIDTPQSGVSLRFEVTDTGIGMSEEVCERLFGSFVQADNSTSRKYGGTGLGLSISKKLVELMGGKIGVLSKEGQGSTFWFEIPTQEVGTDASTVVLPSLDGISVLSVEDHPQGGKEIVNSLRSMGATVELCTTYKEGLELITRRPFDVAVIDQGLPDGLGLDLIKEIAALRPNMGLVMYTVRDDVGLSHSLQALGVTYLTKPAARIGLGEAVLDATSKIERMEITGPTKMLIAEDTESVRDILGRQLDKLGVAADFVENGTKALESLNTGQYGILITDLHMPEMDGYQLVEHIRTKEKLDGFTHFPIIVLTADVQMAQRETYLKHGFDECLLKPVSLGQFKQLLVRWGLLITEDKDRESPNAHLEQKRVKGRKQEELDNGNGNGNKESDEPLPARTDTTTTSHKNSSAPLPPAVDIGAIKSQMGAFDESTIEMMQMFVDMTQSTIESIQTANMHGDFHELGEAGHSLKGAARSACCPTLGDLADTLQDNGEKQIPSGDLVDDIIAEFERVRNEVKAMKAP